MVPPSSCCILLMIGLVGCTAPTLAVPGTDDNPPVTWEYRTIPAWSTGYVFAECHNGTVRRAAECSSTSRLDYYQDTVPSIDTSVAWACWARNHTAEPAVLKLTIECELPPMH